MINLNGSTYIVFGVANKNSICWAIAEGILKSGGRLVLVCHPSAQKRVKSLASSNEAILEVVTCDVSKDAKIDTNMDACFECLKRHSPYSGIVHGIAYTDSVELRSDFVTVSRANFLNTLDVSCFSLIDIVSRAESMLQSESSIVTLTFEASQGTYPGYGIMGVAKASLEAVVRYLAVDIGKDGHRINAVSPSPTNTLSARGVRNFQEGKRFSKKRAPLERCATHNEIANEVVYLLSEISSGVTGQVRFVDGGASSVIMPSIKK